MKNHTSPYVSPTPEAAQAFCSAVLGALELPMADLTKLWTDTPAALKACLTVLNYRPALFHPVDHIATNPDYKVVLNLSMEGKARTGWRDNFDVVIMDGFSPSGVQNAKEMAKYGKIVILKIIADDLKELQGIENIYLYAGNQHDAFEIEAFVRDVLFRERARFYCGKSKPEA